MALERKYESTLTEAQLVFLKKLREKKQLEQDEQLLSSRFIELTQRYEDSSILVTFMDITKFYKWNEIEPYLELIYKTTTLLRHELAVQKNTQASTVHNDVFTLKAIPNMDFYLCRIISYLYSYTDLPFAPAKEIEGDFVLALANLRRYLKKTRELLNENNVIGLFDTSLYLSMKMDEDTKCYKNSYAATVFAFNRARLFSMKLHFMSALNWELLTVVMADKELVHYVEYAQAEWRLRNSTSTHPVSLLAEMHDWDEALILNRAINLRYSSEYSHMTKVANNGAGMPSESEEDDNEEIHALARWVAPKNEVNNAHQANPIAPAKKSIEALETKKIPDEQLAALDKQIKEIEEKVGNKYYQEHEYWFRAKLSLLEYVLADVISASLKDPKEQLMAVKEILSAIQSCRDLERKKGTPEGEIRPSAHARDYQGRFPLWYAMLNYNISLEERLALVQQLLDAGAEPDSYTKPLGWGCDYEIPLVTAILSFLPCLKLLLDKKPDATGAINYFIKEVKMHTLTPQSVDAFLDLVDYAVKYEEKKPKRSMIQSPAKLKELVSSIDKNHKLISELDKIKPVPLRIFETLHRQVMWSAAPSNDAKLNDPQLPVKKPGLSSS